MERGTGLAFRLLSRLLEGATPSGQLVGERASRRLASGWQGSWSGKVQTCSKISGVITPTISEPSAVKRQLTDRQLHPQKLVQTSAPTLPPLLQTGALERRRAREAVSGAYAREAGWPNGYHPLHSLGGQRWFSQTPSESPAVASDGEVVASEKSDTAFGRQVVPSEGSVASPLSISQPESIVEGGSSSPPHTTTPADASFNAKRDEVSPSFVKEVQPQVEQALNLNGTQANNAGVSSSHSAHHAIESLAPLSQLSTQPDLSAAASSSDSSSDHGPPSQVLAEEPSDNPPTHSPSLVHMQPESTTPPSDLARSLPTPAACDVASPNLSQETIDAVLAQPSQRPSQSRSPQGESSNASRKSRKGQRAEGTGTTNGDQQVSQDNRQSKENITSTSISNRVVKTKRGSQQSSGGAPRQTRAENWPRAAQHLLAPVEYLTSRYGNLEITHPRHAVYAPNLDSRPEGFEFTGFEVVFFGTSSNVPSLWRNMSCTAVRIDKSTFLIDCGDGSLQQLLRGAPFRLGSVERIFITHMHGDHVHGLAAMLIYLGLRTRGAASQGKDADIRPVHVYGPLGLRHFLRILLSATHAGVDAGYAVHELLPPDEREQRSRRIDEFLLPHRDELPGKDIVCDSDGTWHVFEDANLVVKAGAIKHTIPCFGYAISEKVKPGRFDREKAEALDIHRDHFGPLSRGKSHTLPDGRTIHPEDVVGPPRRGRKIVVLGDTCESSSLYRAGWDCDLLVHEATVLQEERERDAFQMGHSTATMAGQAARAMDARTLVLTHISPRYQYQVGPGVDAARTAFGSDRVLVAEDHTRIQVEYQEERARQRHVDALLRPQDRKLPPEEQWKKATRIPRK
ncbi:hypothetical protein KFL_001140090 [Klebsormidium nitens]|uniref:Uncharacterized protein n=1 Tax=Klebsormidium nitens TaxID=105231 RepID=A0A1Y1I022_KLENI|nr:hypothetical protein KFL_001140090 [Klebsormidium nitens]|eukprot:GAQ82521.1 hypothetical protein KFL_001140090 [Klebsormidium nitens]